MDASAAEIGATLPSRISSASRPSVAAGIGGSRVHLGEVDRDVARLGRAEARDECLGPAAALVLGADLGLGPPRRPAQEDRLPGIRDVARDRPVAGRRRRGDASPRAQRAAWWRRPYSSRSA